jgi:ABC-type dipeptide/oligopeptide/nickel transport system permease subunit
VIYSARTTLIFTFAVVISGSVLIGLTLGLIAGYRGGWIDTVILRTGEVLSGIPTLILILALTAAFRTRIDDISFWLKDNTFLDNDARTLVKMTIIIVASLPFGWIGSARIVRGQAFSIREQEFVQAAEAMGAGTWRIVWRHVFPGILPLFLVGVSSGMAAVATLEVGLSYLGLGIDPPSASFGNLIADSEGVAFLAAHPHMIIVTAAPLVLFIYAWNLLGDALVDMVQPRHTVR